MYEFYYQKEAKQRCPSVAIPRINCSLSAWVRKLYDRKWLCGKTKERICRGKGALDRIKSILKVTNTFQYRHKGEKWMLEDDNEKSKWMEQRDQRLKDV